MTDEEKKQILQHYVEVIEFRETDADGKVGVYALQLFPEVRHYFNPDDGDNVGDSARLPGPPTPPRTPQAANVATLPKEGNTAPLTAEDAVVCTGVELAPRDEHSS